MRLWDFAVAAYSRPAVSEACLALQDDYGQSVGLLLWRAWTVSEGRAVDPAALAASSDIARRWEGSVTGPLRAVRRSLKSPAPWLDGPAGEALRQRVAEAELEAERLMLEALERNAPPAGGVSVDRLEALSTLATAWTPSIPPAAVERLGRALDDLCQGGRLC